MKTHPRSLMLTAALLTVTGTAVLAEGPLYTETVRISVYNVPDSDFIDYVFGAS